MVPHHAWPTARGAAMQARLRGAAAAAPAARAAAPRRRPTRRPAAAAASPNAAAAAAAARRARLVAELDALLSRATPPSLALAAPSPLDAAGDAAEDGAVALVRLNPSVFGSFGRARMLPKRDYTIDELRLNKIEPEKLLSPRDASLIAVRNGAQLAALLGFLALAAANRWDPGQALLALAGLTFVFGVDAIAFGGGLEALAVDSLGRLFLPEKYARRVALHEAAHFLVAYLCGLLPRGYVLSSWGAVVEAVRAGGGAEGRSRPRRTAARAAAARAAAAGATASPIQLPRAPPPPPPAPVVAPAPSRPPSPPPSRPAPPSATRPSGARSPREGCLRPASTAIPRRRSRAWSPSTSPSGRPRAA